MRYVTVIEHNGAADNPKIYSGQGTACTVEAAAIIQFQIEHPSVEIVGQYTLPEGDYYDEHTCQLDDPDGACKQCGTAVPGSNLYKRLHGID